ncbi:hypothetical protein DL768_002152 [Monosporascus sp. mg162]|nr:hypothetical protein DL768_002152 [Monosporascus sp. mg162]
MKFRAELLESFPELAAQPTGTSKQSELLRSPPWEESGVVTNLENNKGLPSHFIGWHNEYAVSPVHPGYLVLFYEVPPERWCQTSVVRSLTLYNQLKKDVPGFAKGYASEGLAYQIPHTANHVGGIVGRNGLCKAPPDSEQAKRKGVER